MHSGVDYQPWHLVWPRREDSNLIVLFDRFTPDSYIVLDQRTNRRGRRPTNSGCKDKRPWVELNHRSNPDRHTPGRIYGMSENKSKQLSSRRLYQLDYPDHKGREQDSNLH